jgi:HEAT repeat protein
MLALTLLAAVLAAPGPARGRPAPADAAAGSTATPAPATLQLSDAELHERVQAYLGAIDRPVRDESWRALGPAAIPELEAALASDDLPTRRASAAQGLAAIGGDRARAALVAHARAEGEPYVVRAASLRGAARVVPPAEAATELGPVLTSARSAQVREAAADALAGTGDPSACAAVQAQAKREGTRGVTRYEKALGKCR